MVDVVANHYGFAGPGNAVDYSQLHPFNRQDAFHPFCFITNYNNQSDVENVGDLQLTKNQLTANILTVLAG